MWKVIDAFMDEDVAQYKIVDVNDENNWAIINHETFKNLYETGKLA